LPDGPVQALDNRRPEGLPSLRVFGQMDAGQDIGSEPGLGVFQVGFGNQFPAPQIPELNSEPRVPRSNGQSIQSVGGVPRFYLQETAQGGGQGQRNGDPIPASRRVFTQTGI